MQKNYIPIYRYWNSNPCTGGNAEYPFYLAKGKRVLEVGCGTGDDAVRFCKAGANYTGIDLTDKGVETTREKLTKAGCKANVRVMNCEQLDFPDDHFDIVYSFGVIHHTINPEDVIQEIWRVLKYDGYADVMLYNKNSLHYWLEIMFLRKIFYRISGWRIFNYLPPRLHNLRFKYLTHHIINPKPSHQQWISMNTDGIGCPLSRVYSLKEIRQLFWGFEIRTWTLPTNKDHWAIGKFLPKWVERRWGWFRMVRARK